MGGRIHTIELYNGADGAIAQNNSITTDYIDLRDLGIKGYFSLHTIHVGGTINCQLWVCSQDIGTFVEPTTNIDILSAKAAGTYFVSFEPPLAPFIKLKFIETNVAAVTSLKAWLNIQ